ncbi:PaaI family thioesterase [Sphingomonas immobilis]|uniref:Acyl-coenzyme A thioesterase THEM4 n=1 Tax=Sphingomonas immobilis TaxID=3063997 RepID=A0ABT8ZX73_9SPHN|nr:PaaI family thioesterase [Sphingomonas sp. CA1-15]MDO7842170.1 PaaI family thioesterase [Sphingomonas sp. CA1-15]
MSDEEHASAPHWSETWRGVEGQVPAGPAGYGAMIDTLRTFLDDVAAASPDEAIVAALTQDMAGWSSKLRPLAVPEAERIFAHRRDLPGRGQTMSPQLFIDEASAESVRGHVTFGDYYLGGNGAVHGGAIPLLFDEILGRLSNAGTQKRSRTAFLHVDFRSITPIGKRLQIRGWFEYEEGRKRLLKADLRDGDTLCAEAEGLFVELRPGQP